MCAQLSMWCMWTFTLYTWLVVIKPNGSKNNLISMTTLLWGQLWDERSPKKDGCKGRITDTKSKGHNNEIRTIQRGRCEPQVGHSLHEVWILLKVKHSQWRDPTDSNYTSSLCLRSPWNTSLSISRHSQLTLSDYWTVFKQLIDK